MTSTGYDPDKLPAAHRATYYRKNKAGAFEPVAARLGLLRRTGLQHDAT
ncbi:MAG: hypothetical protein U0441_31150 [Polyangiaceae bacterium]